jgi:hypothetical protein
MYYQYVDSWHILKYLHLYLRCILDIIYIYIGSSGEQKNVLNLLFDGGLSARSKVLLFPGHTPTVSVLFTEDLYRYAYTIIQYTIIQYTYTSTIQLCVCSIFLILSDSFMIYVSIHRHQCLKCFNHLTLSDSCGFTAASAEKRTV